MLNLDKEELYYGKTFDDYLFGGFLGFIYKSCLVVIVMFFIFNFFEFLNYAFQFIKLYHVIIFSFLYIFVRTLLGFIRFK